MSESPAEETKSPESSQAIAVNAVNDKTPRPLPAARVTALLPATMEDAMKLAVMLAKSTLVPKEFQGNAANIYIALQWGSELGLAPMQALQSIAVINGRPSLWGDACLALVMASGLCEYIDEQYDDSQKDNPRAVCTVKRVGYPKPTVGDFSLEDAKRAGLAGKSGPWQTYFRRMLKLRARGFALRDGFPDVLRGVITAEEAMDLPTIDVTATRVESGQFDMSPLDIFLSDAPAEVQKEIKELVEKAQLNKGQIVAALKKHPKPEDLIAALKGVNATPKPNGKAAADEKKAETLPAGVKKGSEIPAKKVESAKPADPDVTF